MCPCYSLVASYILTKYDGYTKHVHAARANPYYVDENDCG
jgi:hypothetical protein